MNNIVLVGSVHGSPGATTIALGLAGCIRGSLLVEADCDGGVLGHRLGLAAEPNVASLAAHRTIGTVEEVRDHVQTLPGGVPVLVGSPSAEHATVVWESAGHHLLEVFEALPVDVIMDVGRLGSRSPLQGFLPAAELVLAVARPVPDQLAVVAELVRSRQTSTRLALVLVGDRPYRPDEVEREIQCAVVGVIADDRRAVDALYSGRPGRELARTAFGRSLRALAANVAADIDASRTAQSPESVR